MNALVVIWGAQIEFDLGSSTKQTIPRLPTEETQIFRAQSFGRRDVFRRINGIRGGAAQCKLD
jgi:hypothetical protein